MKYSWYYKWHLWRHAKTVHVAILLLYILAISSFGFLSYQTVSPVKVQAVAPEWTSTGAGEANANGDWTAAGTYFSFPYYTNGAGWFLWQGSGLWQIGDTLGGGGYAPYSTADEFLPGTWVVNGAFPSPPPTVTEYVAPSPTPTPTPTPTPSPTPTPTPTPTATATETSTPAPTPTATPSGGITISGTAYNYDGTGNVADGETVKVAFNGDLQAQTGTTSSGTWSITGVTAPASGDTVTVFIDGVADINRADDVTKYDGSGDITNVQLAERHVFIGSADNQTLSNADMSKYDSSVSGDEDIIFDVDGSNNLTMLISGTKLIVSVNNIYRPASAGGVISAVPALTIQTGATATLDSNTLVITGGGTPLTVNGTFNADTSTVKYTSSFATNIANTNYYNLYLDHVGITFTAAGNITVGNVFTINAGIFNASSRTITLAGSGTPFVATGTFTPSTSTVKYTGASATNLPTATYYNLYLDHSGTTFTAIGQNQTNGVFTINAGTYNAGNYNTVLAGTSGTPFVINGSFDPSTSTVRYAAGNPSGNTNVVGTTYYHLVLGWAAETYVAANDLTATTIQVDVSTFDASNKTITLTGSGTPFTLVGTPTIGIFTPSTSTIKYTGSSATNVMPATYYNLVLDHANNTFTFTGNTTTSKTFTATTAPATLVFNSGSTYAFNTINIAGSSGQLITLRPSSSTNWILNSSNVTKADYLDISKSTNSGVAFCATHSKDSGNNTSWNITGGDSCASGDQTPTPDTPTPNPETPTVVPDNPTPTQTPLPVANCILGNITQVSVDPSEATVVPGQIQPLGIIFKDASGIPVSRDTISGFKITSDFGNSYWKVDPGIGGMQSENSGALQVRIVGGMAAGSYKNGLVFSACGGQLISSATINMTGGSGFQDTIATIIGNSILAARAVASSPMTGPIAAALALAATIVSSSFPVAASIATYFMKLAEFLRYPGAFLGTRRKGPKWGIVYDSVTKRPIEKVRVQIYGDDNKLRETQYTNERGEFGFLVPAGKYQISVTKIGYSFPSNIVPGSSDGQYQTVYHGKQIVIKSGINSSKARVSINLSVPLDQTKMSPMSSMFTQILYSLQRFFAFIRVPILILGTLLTIYLLFTKSGMIDYIFLAIYLILWIFEIRSLVLPKIYGLVKDEKNNPLGLSIVRALNTAGQVKATVVSGEDGKFIFNITPGTYYFDATRLGYKSSRSPKTAIKSIGDMGKVSLILAKQAAK